jgi:hypothetical protein
MDGEADCRKAFANVVDALLPGVGFPYNVFKDSWGNFLFFDADAVFFGHFIWVVKDLLRIESAHSECLVNLSRKSTTDFDEGACMCLHSETTTDQFQERIRAGGDGAWLSDITDNYGCASDLGEWCIYCERQSEVAVIAIKRAELMKSIHVPLRMLGARPAESLWKPEPPSLISKGGEEWRHRLTEHYTPSMEKEKFKWWADGP